MLFSPPEPSLRLRAIPGDGRLLGLHPDQSAALHRALHWRDEQFEGAALAAPKWVSLKVLWTVQRSSSDLLRALSGSGNGDCPRESAQGLEAKQKGGFDQSKESGVEGSWGRA